MMSCHIWLLIIYIILKGRCLNEKEKLIEKIAGVVLAAAVVVSSFTGAGASNASAQTGNVIAVENLNGSKYAITNKKLYIYAPTDYMSTAVKEFQKAYPQYADLVSFECLGVQQSDLLKIYKKVNKKSSTAGIGIIDTENVKEVITNKQYNVAPLSSIGFKEKDYKNAYNYTKQMGKNNKKLYAVAPYVCPSGFIYNKNVAKAVFGSSDPKVVQKYVKDWDAFDKTIELCAEKGYRMVDVYNDADYAMLSNYKFVSNGKIQTKTKLKEYMLLAKKSYDSGATGSRWSSSYIYGVTNDKTLGVFGTTWFYLSINNSKDKVSNKFAMCEGPQAYSWGGEYMVVGSKCANKGLAALFLKYVCGNAKSMTSIAKKEGYMPNNTKAVATLKNNKALNKSISNGLVGNQKVLTIFDKNAKKISSANVTKYDKTAMDVLNSVMVLYLKDEITVDEAIEKYKRSLKEMYPKLQ